MTTSGIPSGSAAQAVPTTEERVIAVMRKSKDVEEQQAQALVSLIAQAGDVGKNLSVYRVQAPLERSMADGWTILD